MATVYRKSQSGTYHFKIFDGVALLQVYRAGKSYSITATKNHFCIEDSVSDAISMESTQLEFETALQNAFRAIAEINKF